MAYLELTETKDRSNDRGSYYNDDDDSSGDDDDDEEYGSRKTLGGMLSRYRIISRFPNSRWHNLGEYGTTRGMLRLQISHTNQQKGNGKKEGSKSNQVSCVTFHFKSAVEGAIDSFIDAAYERYMNELKSLEDHSRYYYEMKFLESGSEETTMTMTARVVSNTRDLG